MLFMRRKMFFVIVGLLFCLGVIGCSSGGNGSDSGGNDSSSVDNNLSSCEKAMKAAADVPDMQDTVEDIDPVIRACGSMDEFIAASSQFPAALDGAGEEIFVTNRCTYNASLQNTAICKSLAK